MEVPALVPAWLAKVCPNLRRLSISQCTLLLPSDEEQQQEAGRGDVDMVDVTEAAAPHERSCWPSAAAAASRCCGGAPSLCCCQHLEHLRVEPPLAAVAAAPAAAALAAAAAPPADFTAVLVRGLRLQQASLPRLTHLHVPEWRWAEPSLVRFPRLLALQTPSSPVTATGASLSFAGRAVRAAQVSTTIMHLTVDQRWLAAPVLHALPDQFPNLTELKVPQTTVMDAAGLQAVLRLRRLTHLHCFGFNLRSEPRAAAAACAAAAAQAPQQLAPQPTAAAACAGSGSNSASGSPRAPGASAIAAAAPLACGWARLVVETLDVDSFARLPLGSIGSLSGVARVTASSDPWAVARVLAAVKRWSSLAPSALLTSDAVVFECDSQLPSRHALTTLPVIASLGSCRHLTLEQFKELSPAMLRALGALLPPRLQTLTLEYCSFAAGGGGGAPHDAAAVWRAVLPSLPARVAQLRLRWCGVSTEQLAAMCAAADKPVRVCMQSRRIVGDEARALVRQSMEEAGHQHVTLEEEAQDCA